MRNRATLCHFMSRPHTRKHRHRCGRGTPQATPDILDGPGFQFQPVESAVTGTYPAFEQWIGAGRVPVLTEAGAPAMRL